MKRSSFERDEAVALLRQLVAESIGVPFGSMPT
jgi:hypothetical protein